LSFFFFPLTFFPPPPGEFHHLPQWNTGPCLSHCSQPPLCSFVWPQTFGLTQTPPPVNPNFQKLKKPHHTHPAIFFFLQGNLYFVRKFSPLCDPFCIKKKFLPRISTRGISFCCFPEFFFFKKHFFLSEWHPHFFFFLVCFVWVFFPSRGRLFPPTSPLFSGFPLHKLVPLNNWGGPPKPNPQNQNTPYHCVSFSKRTPPPPPSCQVGPFFPCLFAPSPNFCWVCPWEHLECLPPVVFLKGPGFPCFFWILNPWSFFCWSIFFFVALFYHQLQTLSRFHCFPPPPPGFFFLFFFFAHYIFGTRDFVVKFFALFWASGGCPKFNCPILVFFVILMTVPHLDFQPLGGW